ncbi:MAG: hypothetical protein QXD43_05550 [Candidatus Aenigmatarchaeota archaeon]
MSELDRSDEFMETRKKFIQKIIEVSVCKEFGCYDGYCEEWELEKICLNEDRLVLEYKLVKVDKYKHL